jgi:hypothetical protein
MGPEGGDGGGRVVVAGTPEDVSAEPTSHTGLWLKRILGRAGAGPAAQPAEVAEVPAEPPQEFDVIALFEAMDQRRRDLGLSWRQVADEIWNLSADLNRRLNSHPISPSTITNMPRRRGISCQDSAFFLRWLGRTPESFMADAAGGPRDVPLPPAGPDRRLYDALADECRRRGQTWSEVAEEIGCAPNQLTALKTAAFGTGMTVAMGAVAWLGRPAADFVHPAEW